MAPNSDEKPATPASYASFDQEPQGGVLRVIVQFIAIPLLIVSVAIGLWMGGRWLTGAGAKSTGDFVELLRSDTINRRWQAAYELANRLRDDVPQAFHDPELLDALGDALNRAREEKQEPPRMAMTILLVIARIADPASLPVVRDAVTDEDPWIRSYAVLALGALDDRESIPQLRALASDEDHGTRRAALRSLARIDRQAGIERLTRPTRQIAVDLLGDPHFDVRMTAAVVLSKTGEAEEAKPVLLKMLDRDHLDSFEFHDEFGALDPNRVRSNTVLAGIKAVVRLGYNDPPVLEALATLADDDTEIDPVVRERARKALRELNNLKG